MSEIFINGRMAWHDEPVSKQDLPEGRFRTKHGWTAAITGQDRRKLRRRQRTRNTLAFSFAALILVGIIAAVWAYLTPISPDGHISQRLPSLVEIGGMTAMVAVAAFCTFKVVRWFRSKRP